MFTGLLKAGQSHIFKWGIYLLLAAVAVLAVYFIKFSPVTIEGHRVVRGEITAEVMGTGTLEAKVQSVVGAKISGRISELLVDQGDSILAGDVLVRLDDSELRQQVEIARSANEAAQATVDRSRSDTSRTQAILDQAELEYQRNSKLSAGKIIPANELDKVRMSLKVAEADLSSALAKVVEAQKNLTLSRNNLDYHLARLDDTVIRAPFSGLVIRRDRDPGDIVVPGTSIFLIISPDHLWVRAWVDESEMTKLAVGQAARLVFRSQPDQEYSGSIARLGRETDRETRQFIVDVLVDQLPVNWSVGQRADVFLQTDQKKGVVVLPADLLLRNELGFGVVTVEQRKSVWRSVRPGLHGRNTVEILAGLSEGDTVVVGWAQKKISLGRSVEVTAP